jgi:hypothetical protein
MKRIVLPAILAVATTVPAFGQTAVGVGLSKSQSTAVSGSKATAIGGGNATGGGGGSSAVTIAGNPAATVSTINNEGTSTVKNVPSVFAPGLAAAGLETCLGSVSGGGSFVGTGFSFGSTIPDPGCAARLDARTLWSMGLKQAAVARLCLNGDIYRAMPEVCVRYLPQAQPATYLSAEALSDGQIWLVEGSTGQDRLCNIYDAAQQRCRVWAHAGHVAHKQRHVTRISHTMATPAAPAAEPSKDDSK